ncbi:MAG TPA: hypothetical protein VK541_04055 [Pedobacter sp.]|uniref:hypothetical protein n=1 Tax=Pedobacter sp. TaxID=1411316 RepID=UPI002C8EF4CA|nr:hypothetical protein [Pedobacter sp.]HMI01628.1 hypothetical protein [Pedobacter sp.]
MAAIIENIIPQQGFEKVRDAIGIILTEELNHQKQLQGFDEEITVYSERITPMDEAEDLYFNVLLDSATYGGFTQKDSQGRTLYFIDVYTAGLAKSGKSGESYSTDRLHKFMGMARYILSYSEYKTLGFEPGLIGGTYVESFATLDPAAKEDSNYTRFGRLQFAVRIQENQLLWQGIELLGNDTTVKLEETNKGFKYIIDNN